MIIIIKIRVGRYRRMHCYPDHLQSTKAHPCKAIGQSVDKTIPETIKYFLGPVFEFCNMNQVQSSFVF